MGNVCRIVTQAKSYPIAQKSVQTERLATTVAAPAATASRGRTPRPACPPLAAAP